VSTETLIAVLVVLVVVIAGIALVSTRGSRSQHLREKFGPEYDYTLEKLGDKRVAEETLAEREKRISKLNIRDLDEHERDRYKKDWSDVQAEFVDDPSKSIEKANQLITEVMVARGFPVADFEQRAADLSVLYPEFVSNYRSAYDIAQANQNNRASTEELRQSIVYYRSMFAELLGIPESKDIVNEKEIINP
jgi:hypothetical protein